MDWTLLSQLVICLWLKFKNPFYLHYWVTKFKLNVLTNQNNDSMNWFCFRWFYYGFTDQFAHQLSSNVTLFSNVQFQKNIGPILLGSWKWLKFGYEEEKYPKRCPRMCLKRCLMDAQELLSEKCWNNDFWVNDRFPIKMIHLFLSFFHWYCAHFLLNFCFDCIIFSCEKKKS